MTELKQYCKMIVENLFSDLVVRYGLKSGDISPLDQRRVDDFVVLLEDFVKNNEVK